MDFVGKSLSFRITKKSHSHPVPSHLPLHVQLLIKYLIVSIILCVIVGGLGKIMLEEDEQEYVNNG